MRARILAAAMAAIAAILTLFFVLSRGPDPGAVPTATQVSSRIMSPYCEGLLVADCPSIESAQLRSRIHQKVEAGWTNAQIDAWLVANYGEQILGRPRASASWMIPLFAIATGTLTLALLLQRWRRASPPTEDLPLTQDEHARVTADFDRFAGEVTE